MSKFNKNEIINEKIRHREYKTLLRFLNNLINTEDANDMSNN